MNDLVASVLKSLLDAAPEKIAVFTATLAESRQGLADARAHRDSGYMSDVLQVLAATPDLAPFGDRLREVLDQRIAVMAAEEAFCLEYLSVVSAAAAGGEAAGRALH